MNYLYINWGDQYFADLIFCVHNYINILNPFSNENWNLESGGWHNFMAITFWTPMPIIIKNWNGLKALKQNILNPFSNRRQKKVNSIYIQYFAAIIYQIPFPIAVHRDAQPFYLHVNQTGCYCFKLDSKQQHFKVSTGKKGSVCKMFGL